MMGTQKKKEGLKRTDGDSRYTLDPSREEIEGANPFRKSEPKLTLSKSLGIKYASNENWTDRFRGYGKLYVEALELTKQKLELDREGQKERKRQKTWRELDAMPAPERARYREQYRKIDDALDKRHFGVQAKCDALETKLLDEKIVEAKAERMGKSNPKDDGKPGESLEETSTEELQQTLADLTHRLKAKPGDKAILTRQKAISAELKGRRTKKSLSSTSDLPKVERLGKSEVDLKKAGPFIGPKGGKWADAKHTIPWKKEGTGGEGKSFVDQVGSFVDRLTTASTKQFDQMADELQALPLAELRGYLGAVNKLAGQYKAKIDAATSSEDKEAVKRKIPTLSLTVNMVNNAIKSVKRKARAEKRTTLTIAQITALTDRLSFLPKATVQKRLAMAEKQLDVVSEEADAHPGGKGFRVLDKKQKQLGLAIKRLKQGLRKSLKRGDGGKSGEMDMDELRKTFAKLRGRGAKKSLGLTFDLMKAKPKTTTIQTLIFDKERFDAKQAKAWAAKNDFSSEKIDTTGESHRLRQKDPGQFQDGSFRTKTLTEGVQAVIGRLKKSSDEGLEKAKYLSRKKVGDRWQYTYAKKKGEKKPSGADGGGGWKSLPSGDAGQWGQRLSAMPVGTQIRTYIGKTPHTITKMDDRKWESRNPDGTTTSLWADNVVNFTMRAGTVEGKLGPKKAESEGMEKAKYVKRTGTPGNYRYEYTTARGKKKTVPSRGAAAKPQAKTNARVSKEKRPGDIPSHVAVAEHEVLAVLHTGGGTPSQFATAAQRMADQAKASGNDQEYRAQMMRVEIAGLVGPYRKMSAEKTVGEMKGAKAKLINEAAKIVAKWSPKEAGEVTGREPSARNSKFAKTPMTTLKEMETMQAETVAAKEKEHERGGEVSMGQFVASPEQRQKAIAGAKKDLDEIRRELKVRGEAIAPKAPKMAKSLRQPRAASHGLTPSHIREETAHADAVLRSKIAKGPEDVVIDGGRASVLAKSRDGHLVTTEVADVLLQPPPLTFQRVLCKSVFPGGCDEQFSKALSACPGCGAGTVESRGMPSFSEIGVEVTSDAQGFRRPREPADVVIKD